MIPDAAVEAALHALFPDASEVRGFTRDVQEPIIRTILEAAAPHMLMQAWDEGMEATGDVPMPADYALNPYRSQA